MYWLISLVGALLVGALLAYLVSKVFGRGERLPAVTESATAREHWDYLNNAPLGEGTIRDVKFSPAIRGYNQEEVDAFLARIAADYAARRGSDDATRQGGDSAARRGGDSAARRGGDSAARRGSDDATRQGSDYTARQGADHTAQQDTEAENSKA